MDLKLQNFHLFCGQLFWVAANIRERIAACYMREEFWKVSEMYIFSQEYLFISKCVVTSIHSLLMLPYINRSVLPSLKSFQTVLEYLKKLFNFKCTGICVWVMHFFLLIIALAMLSNYYLEIYFLQLHVICRSFEIWAQFLSKLQIEVLLMETKLNDNRTKSTD